MGDEEESRGSNEASEKPGGLRGIMITAAFTLLGGVIGVLGKGCYDLAIEKQKSVAELQLEQKKVDAELNLEKEKFEENKKLERQKLDSDLVKLALQASGVDKGGETLGFMVDTSLIVDPEIRKGVKAYLDSKKPVPALSTSNPNPSTEFRLNGALESSLYSELNSNPEFGLQPPPRARAQTGDFQLSHPSSSRPSRSWIRPPEKQQISMGHRTPSDACPFLRTAANYCASATTRWFSFGI